MSESCTLDCSQCSQDCAKRQSKSMPEKESLNALSKVKKVIGVVSGKGGVGKSMVASMLAVLLQRQGYRTALMDADITGPSIPKIFGLKEKAQGSEWGIFPVKSKTGIEVISMNLLLNNDTDPVIWRGPIVAGAAKQFWTDVIWKDIDFMLIDMPPGTGDVPLTVFQSIPVDGIVIVTSPQDLVSMIVNKAVHMARMMQIPILGIVENYSYYECPDCGKRHALFGESHIERLAAENKIDTVAKLPVDSAIAQAADAGEMELFAGEWLDGLAGKLRTLIS